MSDPAWLPYVGVVTGAVGMITGVTGMVISIANYRRVSRMKALDLRLELRKTYNASRATAEGLFDLINGADTSRVAVLAAIGGINSGNHQLWQQECAADRVRVEALLAKLAEADTDFAKLTPEALESAIVEIADLKAQADGHHDKYVAALAADDRSRERIRAEAVAMAQARLTGELRGG